MADAKYEIRKFDKALHDRSAFSCGVDQIDNWLKNSISDQIKYNRLVVWCATDQERRLCGFYALNAHSVRPEAASALARRKERNPIPVIYLPAIAVASDLQGQSVGTALMGHAIRQGVDISEKAGTAALVLDVLEDDNFDRRKAFYEQIGFTLLGDDPKRFYLPMNTARASLIISD